MRSKISKVANVAGQLTGHAVSMALSALAGAGAGWCWAVTASYLFCLEPELTKTIGMIVGLLLAIQNMDNLKLSFK